MVEERIYTIPLRKEFSKAPSYRRTKRALKAIKEFLMRHTKSDNIKIGRYLNLELWKHGRKNPPPRIKVKVVKETIKVKDKDVIFFKAELINAPIEVKKVEEKKKKTKIEVQETKAEEQVEKLSEEKKEVLENRNPEYEKVEHRERGSQTAVSKTKPTQKEKRAGIIGSTGKK